ncbi:PadR family transcriptional regulator [Halalkalibacter urbisdiaboli]|uniref:PadR family transcriptional regulator n=1 Tax=Halalkalibacter urbisdiaboli TaxID=1960589 RepID=UPI000B43B505|nr:PadR family transcriptional regulator [Halalkalibacter urbisdiaboli]
MEDELKNIKQTMNRTVFKNVTFSSTLQSKVLSQLQRATYDSNDVMLFILSSLVHEAKTGYDVLLNIEQMGEEVFTSNEGELYQVLHKLEFDQLIRGEWINEEKYYSLTNKGKNYLKNFRVRDKVEDRYNELEGWT